MPTNQVRFSGTYYRTTTISGFEPVRLRQDVSTVFTESSSGVSNPKWREQVLKHSNASTPYSCDRLKYSRRNGWGLMVKNTLVPGQTLTEESSGSLMQATTVPQLGSAPGLESRAYELFAKNANKELRALQSFISFGELRETLHMIKHPLESLKNGLSDYLSASLHRSRRAVRNSGRRSRARIIGDVISGTYLEYANGWKPFASDIVAASRVLAEQFNPSGLGYRKVNAVVKGPTVSIVPAAYISGAGGYISWYQQEIEKRDSSCRFVGEVMLQCDGSPESLLRNAGFSLGEFVPTLWELLPLSYVADYFANTGSLLEAWCFNRSFVSWWCLTSKHVSERKHVGVLVPVATPGGPNGLIKYVGDPGEVVFTRTGLVRSIPLAYMPSLAFTLPEIFVFQKLANTSSLLWQAQSTSKQISGFYR